MPALDAAPAADLLAQYGGIALILVAGLAVLAYFVLIIAAFLGSLTSRLDVGMKLVWAIFIICAPFLGAVCWFLIGRRSAAATAR
ncbi:PLDc N-terminal domain-containing protein [Nocardiopsis sp. RSe5-2]|uniref:PLDc N-terminal domain-containing protein n=1 Tax=Nocardiopsis endophytica TaxID=3018445 RepID=A0ABT4TWQ4_9ACTN|nr:PLDc N-terminal domain-containing protein [Nocardiopsis endophytica]MDA2809130.1 PLDc N-terminal domain-containing protein [Nocardiopsis endophytica]